MADRIRWTGLGSSVAIVKWPDITRQKTTSFLPNLYELFLFAVTLVLVYYERIVDTPLRRHGHCVANPSGVEFVGE